MGGPVVGRPIAAASGNVAAAVATATLTAEPAGSNRKIYLCGFQATGAGSTAGAAVNLTVTGLEAGTLTYTFTAPVGVLVPAQPLIVIFDPPLPAASKTTDVVVSMPSLGAGNTNAAIVANGYRIES